MRKSPAWLIGVGRYSFDKGDEGPSDHEKKRQFLERWKKDKKSEKADQGTEKTKLRYRLQLKCVG